MSLSWLNPRCLGWSPNPSSSSSFFLLLRPSPTTPFQHWSSVSPDPSLWHAVRCGSPPTPSSEFSLSVLSTQLWKPSPKPSALPYPWRAPTPRTTNCHRMTECIKPGRGRCKCLTSADWQLLSNRALCLIHTFPKPKNRIWPKAGEWPYACREPDLTALKLKNHTYSDFPTIINMLCKPKSAYLDITLFQFKFSSIFVLYVVKLGVAVMAQNFYFIIKWTPGPSTSYHLTIGKFPTWHFENQSE